MGLLDELEKEAARLGAAEDQGEAAREAREKLWREELQPLAIRLGEYLTRLAKTLTAAQRRIRLVHPIAGYGDVVSFGEAPFECRVSASKVQHEIEFTYVAQADPGESTLVVAETPGKVRFVAGVLQNHRLSGIHAATKNANDEVVSARFQARGRIPVRLHVLASEDSGQMKMSLSNVESLGTVQHMFTASVLNDDMFDKLGRYLLGEDSGFTREKVDADKRRQWQSQVQQDQMRREWETKLAMQLQKDEAKVMELMAPTASPAAFIGRMRRSVGRIFRRGE